MKSLSIVFSKTGVNGLLKKISSSIGSGQWIALVLQPESAMQYVVQKCSLK